MAFSSLQEIIDICTLKKQAFWEVILQEDMSERDVEREESLNKMSATWAAMLSAAINYDPNLRSGSGLVGGDGHKMGQYHKQSGENSL